MSSSVSAGKNLWAQASLSCALLHKYPSTSCTSLSCGQYLFQGKISVLSIASSVQSSSHSSSVITGSFPFISNSWNVCSLSISAKT